jgi:hypothetical protein
MVIYLFLRYRTEIIKRGYKDNSKLNTLTIRYQKNVVQVSVMENLFNQAT